MWTKKSALAVGAGGALLVGGLVLPTPNVAIVATGLALFAYVLVGALQDRRVGMSMTRQASSERIFETETLDIQYQLQNVGKSPAFVEVRDTLPDTVKLARGSNFSLYQLRPGASVRGTYGVQCPIRGHYAAGPPGYRVRDIFALFYEESQGKELTYFTVYPQEEAPRDIPASSSTPNTAIGTYSVRKPGQGMEFFGLRQYAVGDSFRDVNWKASAKSKDLVVNQRQHETTAEVTAFLDARAIAGAGRLDSNPLLLSCRGVSTILSHYLDKRDRLRLVTYGETIGVLGPDDGERHKFKVLDHLAALEPKGGQRLGDALDKVLAAMKKKSPVIILSSLVDDPTITEVASTLRTLECSILVITPDPVAAGMAEGDPVQQEFLRLEREAAIRKLRGYGATIVEWDPKETLTISLLQGVIA
ncbi:MAG TPA: DUF58 domain-containing protein [Candidatus Thermoplasmatota archaeon]|nr:DUF58 domain-containing protein [Candidatus Thermoplasmatota archaeon]